MVQYTLQLTVSNISWDIVFDQSKVCVPPLAEQNGSQAKGSDHYLQAVLPSSTKIKLQLGFIFNLTPPTQPPGK